MESSVRTSHGSWRVSSWRRSTRPPRWWPKLTTRKPPARQSSRNSAPSSRASSSRTGADAAPVFKWLRGFASLSLGRRPPRTRPPVAGNPRVRRRGWSSRRAPGPAAARSARRRSRPPAERGDLRAAQAAQKASATIAPSSRARPSAAAADSTPRLVRRGRCASVMSRTALSSESARHGATSGRAACWPAMPATTARTAGAPVESSAPRARCAAPMVPRPRHQGAT